MAAVRALRRVVPAWIGLGLAAALGAVAALGPQPPFTEGLSAFLAVWLVYALTGTALATVRPSHPIGWLFLSMGLAAMTSAVFQSLPFVPSPTGAVTALLANLWVVAFALLATLLIVFPDGKLPSRRWRPVGVLVWVVIASGLLTSGPAVAFTPVGQALGAGEMSAAVADAGQTVSGVGLVALLIAGPVALATRYRRAVGTERQQLKWFAYAAVMLGLAFVFVTVAYFTPALRSLDPGAPVPPAMFGGVPFLVSLMGIPLAAAVAILRYRLYDIDVLIRRTLVYGALSAALAVVYWASVIVLQGVLSQIAGVDTIAVVGSTLAVAALFQPARRQIQGAVDRRFYRSRYDTRRTVEHFSARLRDEVDMARVTGGLAAVVNDTLQPTSVSIWLRREAAP